MITGKILKMRGWQEGRVIGLAKAAAQTLSAQGETRENILDKLDEVRAAPESFTDHELFGALVAEIVRRNRSDASRFDDALRAEPLPYRVWGAEGIDQGAMDQMNLAVRLPVAVAGALMPDAHVGYGLPIGGVLATQNTVIPYAVGVDIACRMRLSIYEASPHILGQHKARFEKSLSERTCFGSGNKFDKFDRPEHEVLDDEDWGAMPLLRPLRYKAMEQLGTSGSGNHFVEWGEFTLTQRDPKLGLDPGTYLALLSHSGSRGVGFKIANEYSRLARALHPRLDTRVQYLAWLDMDSPAGEEYWLAMELAGRFASACHQVIHQRVAKAAGFKELVAVENHHNFAWREKMADGTEAIVHRKGATPAGAGVLGIIPGSMADPGYVVRGRGQVDSLQSASHGAGRKMARRQAISTLTNQMRESYLARNGVKLLGGGLDESPQAYKDIREVIAAQDDLVEVLGSFLPRIVRMADEAGDV